MVCSLLVNADEAMAWDALHASFEMKLIDHGQAPKCCSRLTRGVVLNVFCESSRRI
jgi:hypothetical protein